MYVSISTHLPPSFRTDPSREVGYQGCGTLVPAVDSRRRSSSGAREDRDGGGREGGGGGGGGGEEGARL